MPALPYDVLEGVANSETLVSVLSLLWSLATRPTSLPWPVQIICNRYCRVSEFFLIAEQQVCCQAFTLKVSLGTKPAL